MFGLTDILILIRMTVVCNPKGSICHKDEEDEMKTVTKSTMVVAALVLMGWTLGAKTGFSVPEFETKLTVSDAAINHNFGESVSISGDRAIVGAFLDDDNGNESGSAYIFERCRSSWVEAAKLTASDGAVSDHFGRDVSISGERTIVGARGDDDNFDNSGSVYIYELAIPLVEYTFDGGAEGWTFIGNFPGFDEPLNTDEDGHLGLSPNRSVTSFGFWVSPPITIEAGKTYRARATVSSTAVDPDETLTFRLRANQTGKQRGWVSVVVSTNGEAPSAAETKTYNLKIDPLLDSGNDTIVLSFDMLSFDPLEDRSSWVYLENITLEEAL
jgi:hypothetical protein